MAILFFVSFRVFRGNINEATKKGQEMLECDADDAEGIVRDRQETIVSYRKEWLTEES